MECNKLSIGSRQCIYKMFRGKAILVYCSIICCFWIAENGVSHNPQPVQMYKAIFVKPEANFPCVV